jgi:N-acetylglucosamine-6-phosphate deacetylase
MIVAADRILFPDADAPAAGWLEVEGERLVAAGLGSAPRPVDEHLDGIVAPGYVDVHCHGGGGASFVTEDADVARHVLAAHLTHGVTTMVASLVTGSIDDLERQVATLAALVESGELGGVHLEGPWLASKYKGAHPADLLTDPTPETVERLLAAGRGTVKMVTIAPERTGAMDAVAQLAEAGVVVAVGHTDVDFDACQAAIEAGARGATHLFNAMAPLRHRNPGPVLALWEDPRVHLELIMDGVHVRPELVAFVMATEPGRVVLVTDAMGAACADDGDYLLGELPVEVREGVARIAGTDTIAGSTLTLDQAVRRCVATGVGLAAAVAAATAVAADYLGLTDVGRLAPGKRADLVVLDDDLQVTRVMQRGRWLRASA